MSDSLVAILIIAILVILPIVLALILNFGYSIISFIQRLFEKIFPNKSTNGTSVNALMAETVLKPHINNEVLKKVSEDYELEQRIKSGANWFIWIAILSVINYMVAMMGGNINFIVGLGITQVIYGFKEAMGGGMVFGLNLAMAAVFILFGAVAKRKYNWAFMTGMIIYTVDGLIFLMVNDYLSMGFHAFAIYCIYRGFKANRQLAFPKGISSSNDFSLPQ